MTYFNVFVEDLKKINITLHLTHGSRYISDSFFVPSPSESSTYILSASSRSRSAKGVVNNIKNFTMALCRQVCVYVCVCACMCVRV